MRIVILGAGQVGTSVAQSLVSESNEITVVDSQPDRLEGLQARLDLRTLVGNAVLPSVLEHAGVADADVLIAVTESDQTNLVACKLAHSLFNVPTRIARLRSREFLASPVLLADENFAVSYALCPEQVITDYLVKLVEFPEALTVLSFACGRVALVAVKAGAGGLLVGRPMREMSEDLGGEVEARIAAIFRADRALPLSGDTIVEDGDEVFVLAAAEHLHRVMPELRRAPPPVGRVVIAGGGKIGLRVAQQLEEMCEEGLIERDPARAQMIASSLGRSLVLLGDASDEDLLQQAAIEDADLFLALTNDDEGNIMAASLAKKMGCQRVVALINRRAYVDLVQGGPIDIAISPAQASIGELLTHVRHGFVVKVHSLRRGTAEAIELVVHGDAKTSRVVGRRVGELPPIPGATLAVIVRDEVVGDQGMQQSAGQVLVAHKDEIIQAADHVIAFCRNREVVQQLEHLFQVEVGFV